MMNLLTHLFWPHPSNNYKARVIKPSGILSILALFLFTQFLIGYLTKGAVLGDRVNFTPEQIISETNRKRQELGLPTLRTDETLMLSARAKGQDMLNKDYWAHVGPEGETPWSFFTQNGYQYKYAGENLARDFDSSSDVVSAWLSSPTHKENLLSSKYQDLGIAVVEGDFEGRPVVIVVQHFGTRLGVAPVPELTKNIESAPLAFSNPTQTRGVGISPFEVKKNMSVAVLGFLVIVLVIDLVVIKALKIVRISGRSLAHFGFLVSLVVILILITKGSVL